MAAPVRLLTVLLLALAALAPLRTLGASQATPEAGAGLGPNLGDRVRVVTFANDTPTEVAAFSVVGLEDPSPLSDPPPDFREIDVDVAVENVGASTYYTSGHDFDAIDADGHVYDDIRSEFGDTRLDDPTAAYGAGGSVEPGQAIRLGLTFQLPENAVLAQIVHYTIDYRRTLLDLRPSRPGYGDTVPVVDSTGAEFATIAVSAPTDPYVPPAGVPSIVFPSPGERDVTFPVTVENTGEGPFTIYIDDFAVFDSHGALTRAMPDVGFENASPSPFLRAGITDPIAPGSTSSGLVRFRIPEDADVVGFLFSPTDPRSGDDGFALTVAESGLRPEPPTSPPLFTPQALEEVVAGDVTPGCDGVVAWAEDWANRIDATTAALDGLPATDEDADVTSIDPAPLRQAAADLRAAAADQAAASPPAVAADANAASVTFFEFVADALERIAEAVESGDQAALDAALAEFDEAGQAFFDEAFSPALDALASACPELNEVE